MSVECTAGRTVPLPRPIPRAPFIRGHRRAPRVPAGAPTACQLRLSRDRALFEPLGAFGGIGECGGLDIVALKRVVTKDRLSVEISPAATLRCETAEAIVDWVREDLVNQVARLGSVLARDRKS